MHTNIESYWISNLKHTTVRILHLFRGHTYLDANNKDKMSVSKNDTRLGVEFNKMKVWTAIELSAM